MQKKNVKRRKKKSNARAYGLLIGVLVLAVVAVFGIKALVNRPGAAPTPTQQPTEQPAVADATNAGDAAVAANADVAGDNLEDEEVSEPVAENQKVFIADDDLSPTEGLPSEWLNVLLLGQDTRSADYYGRTDTMIIASVNSSTGQIKLCSIMRDTELNIEGVGMSRINAAHRFGGPNLIMKTINESFGMNITKYMSVNFASFPFIVEKLGGINIDVKEAEVPYINQGVGNGIYMGEKYNLDESTLDNSFLTTFGPNTLLTGRQALSYARIRHLDSDYMRTARQRNVLNAVLEKVKGTKDATQLMQIATTLLPYVKTNMEMMEMIQVALPVLQHGVDEIAELRLPVDNSFTSDKRDGVQAFYDVNLDTNKQMLHDFIYG